VVDLTRYDVLVIGSGVNGLTTGIRLLEAGLRVRIWTADRPSATTSASAGAYWSPFLAGPRHRVLDWSARGYRALSDLAADTRSGIRIASCLRASRGSIELPWWVAVPDDLRDCAAAELPPGYRTGLRYTVPVIDMPSYLNYLLGRFQAGGGRLNLHPIEELGETVGAADVIVNCAGLGARGLALDPSVRPVRGQTVVVANPGLDGVFVEDSPAGGRAVFIIPHHDVVVLGGTTETGDWRLEPDPATAGMILERCRKIEPRLVGALVLGHRVGLRPVRPEVRLEEGAALGAARLVHNYGHGGAGVTLSWACADDVTTLVTAGG
jgi:D-amino-acid oxidase